MIKAKFYEAFPNVKSRSYREGGTYNYATLPCIAPQFRIQDTRPETVHVEQCT